MRRSDHPSRPNAMTCCLFSSLKTLLTSSEGIALALEVNVLNEVIVGRFSGDYVWPVLGDYRGPSHRAQELRASYESGNSKAGCIKASCFRSQFAVVVLPIRQHLTNCAKILFLPSGPQCRSRDIRGPHG